MLTAITATYCSSFLEKYYSSKYIVDIRDYSHENIWIYNHLEKSNFQLCSYCDFFSDV